MCRRRLRRLNPARLLPGMLLLLAPVHRAHASVEAFAPLFEKPGEARTELEYGFSIYSNADIEGQERTLDETRHRARAKAPLTQAVDHIVSARASFEYRSVFNDGAFRSAPIAIPGDLSRSRLQLDGLWGVPGLPALGFSVAGGTAGDRVAPSARSFAHESAVFFRSAPRRGGEGWILAAHYSNNRNYLNRFPLPGLMYYAQGNPAFRFTVGFPVSRLLWAPAPSVRVRAQTFWGQESELVGTWALSEGEAALLGADWLQTGFLRSERVDPEDRFRVDEKRAWLGLQAELTPGVVFRARGGLAFDRRLSQPSHFPAPLPEREELKLGPALFGALELAARL
jgi:hypothetical protein